MTDSPLHEDILREIGAHGPISVARYMALALGHPTHGYYMTRDPLGAAGDFTTAPEISQMFGELLGLWAAARWRAMGSPDPVTLVELGPGRGTLMADAWRALQGMPDMAAASRIVLVETSPALRAAQAKTLAHAPVVWADSVDAVPPGPSIVLANEFLDALPVHQFVAVGGAWRERLVDATAEGALRFVASPAPTPATAWLPEAVKASSPPDGTIAEASPAGHAVVRTVAERIAGAGGAALFVDYGPARSAPGDSLQAVRGHDHVDVFDGPGTADLTCHVDFASLATTAIDAGAAAHGPVEQGAFLRALGIEIRAQALAAKATAAQRRALDAALHRLCGADQMGQLFKALAITPRGPVPPDGFPDLLT